MYASVCDDENVLTGKNGRTINGQPFIKILIYTIKQQINIHIYMIERYSITQYIAVRKYGYMCICVANSTKCNNNSN